MASRNDMNFLFHLLFIDIVKFVISRTSQAFNDNVASSSPLSSLSSQRFAISLTMQAMHKQYAILLKEYQSILASLML